MHILIVDDNESSLATLEAYLTMLGYTPKKARNGKEALAMVAKSPPDLILLDLIMPGINGFEVCRRLKSDSKTYKIPIIAVTGLQDRESNVKAIEAGVDSFLTKPIDEIILKAHINSFAKMRQLDRELEASRNELNTIGEYHRRVAPGRSSTKELIGISPSIKEVRNRINMVKDSQVPVLILGESGVGKQLVAEAIHWEGKHASEPFVQINCSGLQENLLESELFGHAMGAFTGATHSKKGLIEVAGRGTLFIDELGDMNLVAQSKILLVLDSGLFRRLGDPVERKANARIIAATNQDLDQAIKEGRFRSDLYYRLNVFEIHVPPLRKRKEDIPLLVEYFLAYSSLSTRPDKKFAAEAMEILQEYYWPGNVRELRNVVERAIVFSGENETISPQHLPPNLLKNTNKKSSSGSLAPFVMSQSSRYLTLKEVELRYIREVLKNENGNRTRTARILGISRSTLKKKISENPSLKRLVGQL